MFTYRRRRGELEADPDAPDGVAAFLTKTAVTIGLAAARDVPVAGSLIAPVDTAAVAEQANQARTYLMKKFGDKGEAQLLLSPEDELTPLFVSDLNRVSMGRPMAWFFDTYERTGPALDDWLRNLYAGRYGDLPATLITAISGQMPLDSNLWADYLPIIADLYLEPFTEAEARLFLSAKNITDENTVKVILTLSGRLPLWLATLAEAKPRNAVDVGDPAGDVVERFLRWEDDPVRRGVALAAAFPRILNQDVLAVAAPEGAPLFAWLRGLPFVSRIRNYWEYHEVVRGAMLRLQFAEAPAKWRSSHFTLAQAYERWADDIADKSGNTWTNKNWVDCIREAMYHLLCADPVNNLPRVLESAIKAAEHGNIRLRQWAELIIDASRDTGDTVLSQYGQRLQDLIKGSEIELVKYFTKPDMDASEVDPLARTLPRQAGGSVKEISNANPSGRGSLRNDMSTVPAATSGRQESQIVMLGPPGSGKTTFLAAVSIALTRQRSSWRLIAEDAYSADALIRMTESLVNQRRFPSATLGIEPYNLVLHGSLRKSRRRIFGNRRREEQVRIGLKLIDVAGESMHFSSVGSRAGRDLLDTLAESKGIIFLFDPIREYASGDTFDFVFGVLTQLMQRFSFDTGSSSGRLPHYVAICITKFDEARVFKAAENLNLLSIDPDDPRKFPRVSDANAREFFKYLGEVSASGNGEMTVNMLEQYFRPDRVRYFVTSAIGFHVEQNSHLFDRNDFQNHLPGNPGDARIRGSAHPINVAEPLTWLSTMLLSGSVGSGEILGCDP